MDNQIVSTRVQIITGLAVLVGLGLVILELQQTRTLARAQLTSDGWAEVFATQRSMLSENFNQTFAKACHGSELSDSETVEMISYLNIVMARLSRGREMVQWPVVSLGSDGPILTCVII